VAHGNAFENCDFIAHLHAVSADSKKADIKAKNNNIPYVLGLPSAFC
jgi:hypothetical protein